MDADSSRCLSRATVDLLGDDVEAIGVHDFAPSSHEVVDEFLLVIILGVDFGVSAKNRVRTEDEIDACGHPFDVTGLAIADFVEVATYGFPAIRHVGQVDKEVRAECAFAIGKDAILGAAVVGAEHAQAAEEAGHFTSTEAHELRAIEQEFFGTGGVVFFQPIAEAIMDRL